MGQTRNRDRFASTDKLGNFRASHFSQRCAFPASRAGSLSRDDQRRLGAVSGPERSLRVRACRRLFRAAPCLCGAAHQLDAYRGGFSRCWRRVQGHISEWHARGIRCRLGWSAHSIVRAAGWSLRVRSHARRCFVPSWQHRQFPHLQSCLVSI